MRIVATMMVRDEADIVAAMLEHHLAQGIDVVIVTDNGSVDGTTEILQAYADAGVIELHHDPVHRKQQHSVVTGMARRAFTEHGADWVVNLDADEFCLPVDAHLTLREAFAHIPLELNAFTADVTNLVGPPAERGSGIDRLLWRDRRTDDDLRAVGIHAHPTPNALHRGDPEVVVAQGNHFVSLTSTGQPEPAYALEVLHLPWRSWEQTERKVVNAGRAYAENPDLKPSRNHHGMNDYRRYLGQRLRYHYLLRLPTKDELDRGAETGSFVHETWLRDHLHGLVDTAVLPDQLAASLDSSKDDVTPDDEHAAAVEVAALFIALEQERDDARKEADHLRAKANQAIRERDKARATPQSFPRRARRKAGRVVRKIQAKLPGGASS
jgi:hypothetical protein